MGADGTVTRSWWWRNLPNTITVVRILFAPAVIVLALADGGEGGALRWWAAALFAVGMLTDGLDGHLARKYRLISDFGKIADPIADKGLVGCALLALSLVSGSGWMWAATVLILVREVGVTVYRVAVVSDRVIAARWAGKVKTAWQGLALTAALAPLWRWLGDWATVIDVVLIGIAVILTWYSGIEFLIAARRPGPARADATEEGIHG